MNLIKFSYPLLLILSLLFISVPDTAIAATASCNDSWPVSSSCSGDVAWTSWVYNAGPNNCTRNKYRTGTKQTGWAVHWTVQGPVFDPTQDEGCLNSTSEFCGVLPTPPNPPENNKSGSELICGFTYNWFTDSNDVSAVTENCQVWLDSDVTTRPTITKNAMDTTREVGETISDPATATDPESGSITNQITTSISRISGTGGWTKFGELSYRFDGPGDGTFRITYSVNDPECGSPLPAATRTRDISITDPPDTGPTNWDFGEWGVCASGNQTRDVWCEENGFPADGDYAPSGFGTRLTDESLCDIATKPATSQSCVDPCPNDPYKWDYTPWSPSTCSSGATQTRTVFCEDNADVQSADACCAGLTKPPSTNVCPVDPCSGLSNTCVGTASSCSTYAQTSCNTTNAPGCTWTTSGSCVGTASACSTYGTSTACTTPAKNCSWTSSTGCTGTLIAGGDNCNDWKRYQCADHYAPNGFQSDCEYNACKWNGQNCYYLAHWEPDGWTWDQLCGYQVLPACSTRTNSTWCNFGNGCSWSTSYQCTGTARACSTYSSSVCGTVGGCSWNNTSSCTGTATTCSARNQTQCGQTGSGCQWCPGVNTAPTISVASNQSVCLNTTVNDITTADDAEDGPLTSSIVTNSPTGIVKTTQLSYYFTSVGDKAMTYNVTDSGGLAATQATRTVTVGYCGAWAYGTWGICVNGTQTRTATCMLGGNPVADSFCDPAAKVVSQSCDDKPVITPQATVDTYVYTWINDSTTASDYEDGDITSSIDTPALTNMVKENDLRYYFTSDGAFEVTYDVSDSGGQAADQKSSTINVGYQALWDTGTWGNCDPSTNQRTRTVTCMLSGSPVADQYCPPPKPDTSGACVTAEFECSSDNIHWNDCTKPLFLASPRSKVCTRQVAPIAATSWNWSLTDTALVNTGPRMKVANTESATAQNTCLDFEGEILSPEINRKLRLDIGAGGDGGVVEKTLKIKFINPRIEEA